MDQRGETQNETDSVCNSTTIDKASSLEKYTKETGFICVCCTIASVVRSSFTGRSLEKPFDPALYADYIILYSRTELTSTYQSAYILIRKSALRMH